MMRTLIVFSLALIAVSTDAQTPGARISKQKYEQCIQHSPYINPEVRRAECGRSGPDSLMSVPERLSAYEKSAANFKSDQAKAAREQEYLLTPPAESRIPTYEDDYIYDDLEGYDEGLDYVDLPPEEPEEEPKAAPAPVEEEPEYRPLPPEDEELEPEAEPEAEPAAEPEAGPAAGAIAVPNAQPDLPPTPVAAGNNPPAPANGAANNPPAPVIASGSNNNQEAQKIINKTDPFLEELKEKLNIRNSKDAERAAKARDKNIDQQPEPKPKNKDVENFNDKLEKQINQKNQLDGPKDSNKPYQGGQDISPPKPDLPSSSPIKPVDSAPSVIPPAPQRKLRNTEPRARETKMNVEQPAAKEKIDAAEPAKADEKEVKNIPEPKPPVVDGPAGVAPKKSYLDVAKDNMKNVGSNKERPGKPETKIFGPPSGNKVKPKEVPQAVKAPEIPVSSNQDMLDAAKKISDAVKNMENAANIPPAVEAPTIVPPAPQRKLRNTEPRARETKIEAEQPAAKEKIDAKAKAEAKAKEVKNIPEPKPPVVEEPAIIPPAPQRKLKNPEARARETKVEAEQPTIKEKIDAKANAEAKAKEVKNIPEPKPSVVDAPAESAPVIVAPSTPAETSLPAKPSRQINSGPRVFIPGVGVKQIDTSPRKDSIANVTEDTVPGASPSRPSKISKVIGATELSPAQRALQRFKTTQPAETIPDEATAATSSSTSSSSSSSTSTESGQKKPAKTVVFNPQSSSSSKDMPRMPQPGRLKQNPNLDIPLGTPAFPPKSAKKQNSGNVDPALQSAPAAPSAAPLSGQAAALALEAAKVAKKAITKGR